MKEFIVKETERAVAIENGLYAMAVETAHYDLKELTAEQIQALRNQSSLIWLPKSQITIEDGFVVDMADWLAKQNDLFTDRMIKEAQQRFADGCDRYNTALNFAKQHGLKVKNKMKLKTILTAIKNAGLEF